MDTITNYKGQAVNFDIQSLVPGDILSVYRGKAGRCCCGCAGKHSYASKTREIAGKGRGYAISDDEVNDKAIVRILRKVQANEEKAVIDESSHVAVKEGSRLFVVYFNDEFKAKHPGLCAGLETEV